MPKTTRRNRRNRNVSRKQRGGAFTDNQIDKAAEYIVLTDNKFEALEAYIKNRTDEIKRQILTPQLKGIIQKETEKIREDGEENALAFSYGVMKNEMNGFLAQICAKVETLKAYVSSLPNTISEIPA
jgi:thermostable 8-oxoguanine DNA glycosylase